MFDLLAHNATIHPGKDVFLLSTINLRCSSTLRPNDRMKHLYQENNRLRIKWATSDEQINIFSSG